MRIDWWTLGLQTINAIVLIWLLSRFLFRPVAQIIASRQAAAAKINTDAEALKTAAEMDRAAAAAMEAELKADRAARLKEAADEAAMEREKLIAAARNEAAQLRASAKFEMENSRKDAVRHSEEQAAELAVAIARQLLTRLPDAYQVLPFLPGLSTGIDQLSPAARAGLTEALHVRVARSLSETDREAIASLLAKKLGISAEPKFDIDPTVIAGIELESAQAVVRNSLRADLHRIAEVLARDDR